MPKKENHVSMIIASPYRWETFSVFNANAFPANLGHNVNDCSLRLALCLYYTSLVSKEISKERDVFIKELKVQQKAIRKGLSNRQDSLKFVAYSDGLQYLAATFSYLNAIKSFLDIYAKLMAKLISPGKNMMSFKKKPINDCRNISGGALINWLRDSTPKNFNNANDLADITIRHSNEWITQAVNYRDTLSHFGDIDGMVHMQVQLQPKDPPYNSSNIELPKMPDGVPLVDYCQDIMSRLIYYLKESIILLPNISNSLINPDRLSRRSDKISMI
jgi:hypothetical protein